VTSIQDCFYEYQPRPQQAEAMHFVEENWDKADVFVLQLPVSVGKSNLAMAIARWAHKTKKLKSNILVPTNVLLEQYKQSFSRLHFLQRKDMYRCHRLPAHLPMEEANCDWRKQVFDSFCEDCCYLKAVRQSHMTPYMVCNYWTYMAHKLFKPLVIMDEAHNLINIIRDLEGKRLWRKDYRYPSNITTYGDLLKWVEAHPRRDMDQKLKTLYEELSTGREHYLVEAGIDLYRGREEECLKLLPIDVRNAKPYMWTAGKGSKPGVQKIILLSATFTKIDLEMLGLTKRRVAVMETGSPIPPDRRPVYFMPICNSSFHYQGLAVTKLAAFLRELADARPGTKGFVHITYGMSSKLEVLLQSDPRFMFHDSGTKMSQYEIWRNSAASEGRVFVGCGMEEGLDLKGPDYGWQVLTKVQYASLAEPAIKHQAEERPQEYTWDAMRKCSQACGRICRDPADFGETYLVDLTFKKLFKQAKHFGIVPQWLTEQLDADAKLELLNE
jgi:Rad3-related DNA helicase